jgi:hypothetical protein
MSVGRRFLVARAVFVEPQELSEAHGVSHAFLPDAGLNRDETSLERFVELLESHDANVASRNFDVPEILIVGAVGSVH